MNDHYKQYRKDRYLSIVLWLLAIIVSLAIWYMVGRAFFSLYQYTHPSKKIEFRYNLYLQ